MLVGSDRSSGSRGSSNMVVVVKVVVVVVVVVKVVVVDVVVVEVEVVEVVGSGGCSKRGR